MTLNKKQREAFDKALELVQQNGRGEMAIIGAGGVGKTTTVNAIIEHTNATVAVGAFSHQAVSNLEYEGAKTLASILGLRVDLNKHATDAKAVERLIRVKDPEDADVLIADEYSMIPEHYREIIRETYSCIIWVGDVKQLPPINEKPMLLDGIPTVELTEPMRQGAATNLFKVCTHIRNGGGRYLEFVDGVSVFRHKSISDALRHFDKSSVFTAYTNVEVKQLANRIVNRMDFAEGDIVVVGNTIDPKLKVSVKNGQVFIIKSMTPIAPFGLERFNTDIYSMSLERQSDGEILEDVKVYTGGFKNYIRRNRDFNEKIAQMNRDAKEAGYDRAKDAVEAGKHPMSKKAWSEFWNLFYAWKKIVSIQHRTASTVHKMQGSQTDKIFVLMDGFKGVDAQPLLYTAVTRGRKELHFVKT